MGLLRQVGGVGAASPLQKHEVYVANDLFWITGVMETTGNPHHYINQEDRDYWRIAEAHLAPWTFTGLPSSHVPEVIISRERIQMLAFPGQEAMSQFHPPIRSHALVLYYPLAVIRGEVPFLSEATVRNFLDFWKGLFYPVVSASVYYLTEGMVEMPTEFEVLYLNREMLQNYIEA